MMEHTPPQLLRVMRLNLENQGGAGGWTLISEDTLSQAGNGSAADITFSTAPEEGDIVIIAGVSDLATSRDMSVNTSGYTTLFSNGGGAPDALVSYKVMGATPDTVVNVTPTDFANRDTSWVVQIWRGVDTDNPIDQTTTSASASSGDPNSPSITTQTDDALVFSIGLLDDDDVVGSPTLSGYTNVLAKDTQFGSAGSSVMIASKEVASPSAEDPPTWSTTGQMHGTVLLLP